MDLSDSNTELPVKSYSESIYSSVIAGVVLGLLVVFVRVSLAALIFSGELSSFLAAGIGILLLSSIITGLLSTYFSGFNVAVNGPQDVPAVLIGVMAASIAAGATLPLTQEIFASIVMLMAVCSVLTGAFLWVFGQYSLGRFVRYIPYPVIGGFIAGTGWLLLAGGFSVINGSGSDYLSIQSMLYWMPGVVFALALLFATSRFTSPLVLPIVITVSLILFYLVVMLVGGGIHQGLNAALNNGYLIGPLPADDLWRPVTGAAIQNAEWPLIFDNIMGMIAIALITTVSLLLNCSGLEVVTRSDIDLNRELKSVGFSNIAASVVGSSPTYHFLSLSALNHRMSGGGKLTGVFVALTVFAILIAGTELLGFAPKFIVAGFLMYLGLDFMAEWLYRGWFSLPKKDYVLIWLILVVIATVGLLQGVVAGILIAVVLFVAAYTNTDAVRHSFTRRHFQSHIMRAPAMERMLEKNGDRCLVIELQGFIFFGMAHQLLDQIKARLAERQKNPLNFLLIDFRLVTGLDTSASYAFSRLKQITDQHGITLAFSSLEPNIEKSINSMESNDQKPMVFADIDQAIASVDEAEIELQASKGNHFEPVQLIQYFENSQPDSEPAKNVAERIHEFMQLHSMSEGAVLLNEGDPVRTIYFVESGVVSAQTTLKNGVVKKLRVQGAGTVIGEIGIYTGAPATATVVVTQDAEVYALTEPELRRMEREDPGLAVAAHRLIATTLGRKLAQSNSALLALQK